MFSRRLIGVLVGIILTSFIVTVYFWVNALEREPLPILGHVPDFQLVATDSTNLTSHDLDGKVWVVDFIFTTCQGPCPIMTKNMASLHRSFILEEDVRLVSVTVNPEYDTPEIFQKYADQFDADTQRWYFLTGERDAIHALAVEGFKLGSIEEPVFHSTYMVLVDRQRRIRGYYDGTNSEEVQNLFKDIVQVMKEAS